MLKLPLFLQRALKGGLVAAVAAAAEGLSAFADPDLAAAPSDMPSTSDSGSQTHARAGGQSSICTDADFVYEELRALLVSHAFSAL